MANSASRGRDRLDELWLSVVQGIVDLAAHEIKDVLNGVTLNLEVIRSRSSDPEREAPVVAPFATAASAQLEILTARTEALLFIARPAREPADVAVVVRHLAALLVPAARADGGVLSVDGVNHIAPTGAPTRATRLALASALLDLTKLGGSASCTLERQASASETVVRFSHESAVALTMNPEIADAISVFSIKAVKSASDLTLAFPAP